MNLPTTFKHYLQHLQILYSENEQSVLAEDLEKCLATTSQTKSNPFAFFKWYFNKGFVYYEEYVKDVFPYALTELDYPSLLENNSLPHENHDYVEEKISLANDLTDVFSIEYINANQSISELWNNDADKSHFLDVFNFHFNTVSNKVNLNKLNASSIHWRIKEISTEFYYQMFPLFINHLENLKEDFDFTIPNYSYPKRQDLQYDN
ncbi:MAG: hypothetical protein WKF91_17135, partial [Segetibacter sp.]